MVDDLSGAVVHVAALFSRQTAVEILRCVNRLAQRFIVPDIIASVCISLRGKRRINVVISFQAATQMFPQPLPYATSAASGMVVLNPVGIAGLASVIERTKQYCLQLLYKFKLCLITFFSKYALFFLTPVYKVCRDGKLQRGRHVATVTKKPQRVLQEEKTTEYNISTETGRNEAIAFTVFEESGIIVALDSV